MNLIWALPEILEDSGAGEVSPLDLNCLSRRHRLFLLSPLSEAVLQEKLAATGLHRCLTHWRGSITHLDSELASYLKERGLHPDETALIGATESDWRAAHAAGISAWAALWNTGGKPDPDPQKRADLARQYTEVVLLDALAFEAELQRREAAASRAYPITTVGALIVDEAGHFFLVQTRKWSGKWGIPGGKVDYGEKLEAALRREVREETGLSAEEVVFLLAHEAVESPEFYRPRHFILLNYRVKVKGVKPPFALNHESVNGGWMTRSEAVALDLNEPTRRLFETIA